MRVTDVTFIVCDDVTTHNAIRSLIIIIRYEKLLGRVPVLNIGLEHNLLLYMCKQELSYRKQIARQLRTQYVQDIHRPKYYTQGHWKRNHWTTYC